MKDLQYCDDVMNVCECLCLCVFVCVYATEAIILTSGVIWTPYDWISKLCSYYNVMATVVIIVNGRALGIGTHLGN